MSRHALPDPRNATVPISFLEGMLTGARRLLTPLEVNALAQRCGIGRDLFTKPTARVTQGQFVKMYEVVSLATGDEMLGLWSRPIRGGALKYLVLSLQDAPSLQVALYRFTMFWNLLLDDYRLGLSSERGIVSLSLQATRPGQASTAIGHELMVKLTHGVMSWLAGRRLPIRSVGFGFARPAKFHEYANLFPGPVSFERASTSIAFDEALLKRPFRRSRLEILDFVRRAPDDWIFVTFDHGSTTQRVRSQLTSHRTLEVSMDAAARALNLSNRSLSRKLQSERTSFRQIKDEVRRDVAIERLVNGHESIDQIAAAVGFDDTTAFHRAFRSWTGSTPRRYTGAR